MARLEAFAEGEVVVAAGSRCDELLLPFRGTLTSATEGEAGGGAEATFSTSEEARRVPLSGDACSPSALRNHIRPQRNSLTGCSEGAFGLKAGFSRCASRVTRGAPLR